MAADALLSVPSVAAHGPAPVAGGCSVGAWFSSTQPARLQAPCSAALYFIRLWSAKLGFRRSTSRRVRAWQSPSASSMIMPCTPASGESVRVQFVHMPSPRHQAASEAIVAPDLTR